MRERKSSLRIVLHSITGFIALIVFLIIANLLVSYIHSDTYLNFIEFFNSLLGLFFILFLVGMINGLFWNFEFPLNLLAPISGGVLGVFIVNLIYKILEFAQTFVYFDTLATILSYNIYALVFFATLIIGYLIIFSEESRRAEEYPEKERYSKEENKKREAKEKDRGKSSKSNSDLSWEDVGNEFRKVFLNIGNALNRAFEPKKKKNKKLK